jgi:hypothetical protein
MKLIQPSPNEHSWPRQAVKSIETRKRDLVIRISDWTRDRDEPAYDVEVYVGGVYDGVASTQYLTKNARTSKKQAKAQAVAYAQHLIATLL